MQIGKITQVMGPVVDVHFDETPLPYIQTALQVDNHGKKVVMEVMQRHWNRYRSLYHVIA